MQLAHLGAGVQGRKLPRGIPTDLDDIIQACREAGFRPHLAERTTLAAVQATQEAAAAADAAERARALAVRHRARAAERGLLLLKVRKTPSWPEIGPT
jgi:hypothetical protein